MGRKRIKAEGSKDRIGETIDLARCPTCEEHPDCLACMEGKCTALSISGGQGCVFYKPAEVELAQSKASYRRLKEEGKHDLISKYIKPLTALGVLDDEISEAEAVGRTMEEFEAADYEKQLKESGYVAATADAPVNTQPSETVT